MKLLFHQKKLFLVPVLAALQFCNNYHLLDKLEAPGADSSKFYVFVNPSMTQGDMSGLTNGGCSGTGTQRADCSCQDFAVANGIARSSGAKFVAWLSGTVDDMTCRITGLGGNNCSLPSTSPAKWYNMQDELVAVNYQDLMDFNLSAPIKYQPNKQPTAALNIWTGTDANGLRGGAGSGTANCSDWNSTATASPVRGDPAAITASWSNSGTDATCGGGGYPIYCFQIK